MRIHNMQITPGPVDGIHSNAFTGKTQHARAKTDKERILAAASGGGPTIEVDANQVGASLEQTPEQPVKSAKANDRTIPPPYAALLADMREWAKDPLAVFYNVRGRHRAVAIFPEEVIEKTDENLLRFIVMRCRE